MTLEQWIAYCRAYNIRQLGTSKVRAVSRRYRILPLIGCSVCDTSCAFFCVFGCWLIVVDELFKIDSTEIHHAELARPLCTAIQIALVNLTRRSGIQPKDVIGHSSGEIAAAYAARAISFREAVIISYSRGYVAKNSSSNGGMVAVGLGADVASNFLKDGVVIACENSHMSVTLSGKMKELDKVVEAIKESKHDMLVRTLKVDMAYHSCTWLALLCTYLLIPL